MILLPAHAPVLGMLIGASGGWTACYATPAEWSAVADPLGTNVELAQDGDDMPTFVRRTLDKYRRLGRPLAEPTFYKPATTEPEFVSCP